MFALLFLGVSPEEVQHAAVVFHELPDEQESVDGRDAVAYNGGKIFASRGILLFDEELSPQRSNLVAVVLDVFAELFLAKAYFLKRALVDGGLFW